MVDKKISDNYWDSKNFLTKYYKEENYKPLSFLDSINIKNSYIKDKFGGTWLDKYEEFKPKMDSLLDINNHEEFVKLQNILDSIDIVERSSVPSEVIKKYFSKPEIENLNTPSYFSITNKPIIEKDGSITSGFHNSKSGQIFISGDTNEKVDTTPIHELSHKADTYEVLHRVPKINITNINKNRADFAYDQNFFDYLSSPTEIEARKMSLLYTLNKGNHPYKNISSNTLDSLYNVKGTLPEDVGQLLNLFKFQQGDLLKYLNNDFSYLNKYQKGGHLRTKESGTSVRTVNPMSQEPAVEVMQEGNQIKEVTVYSKRKYQDELKKQQENYLADMAKYKQDSAQWVKANQAYQDSSIAYNIPFELAKADEKAKNTFNKSVGKVLLDKYQKDYKTMTPYEWKIWDKAVRVFDADKNVENVYKKYEDGKDGLWKYKGLETIASDHINNLDVPIYKKPTIIPTKPIKPNSPTTIKYNPKFENLKMRSLWANQAKADTTARIGVLNPLEYNDNSKGFTIGEAMKFPDEVKNKFNIPYIYNQIQKKQSGGRLISDNRNFIDRNFSKLYTKYQENKPQLFKDFPIMDIALPFISYITGKSDVPPIMPTNGIRVKGFHASNSPTKTFQKNFPENYFAKHGGTDEAIFFTDIVPTKESFLSKRPYIGEYNITMRNPAVKDFKTPLEGGTSRWAEFVNESQKKGHDGVIIKGIRDNQMDNSTIHISLDPKKISFKNWIEKKQSGGKTN